MSVVKVFFVLFFSWCKYTKKHFFDFFFASCKFWVKSVTYTDVKQKQFFHS